MRLKTITESETFKGMDEVLPEVSTGFFKGGKVQIIIIFEDMSYKAYYKKLKENYVFTVHKKKYLILSDRIIIGKNPMIIFYYNNPMPIKFNYEPTKVSAKSLRSEDQLKLMTKAEKDNLAKIPIDSEALNSAMTSNLISKMYGSSGLTTKNLIIILVVVAIIILVFLQVFGVVDVMGMISGQSTK